MLDDIYPTVQSGPPSRVKFFRPQCSHYNQALSAMLYRGVVQF